MTTFKQFCETWVPPKREIPVQLPRLTSDSGYYDILREVSRALHQSVSYLQRDMEEDRVEFNVFGFQIRVWRTVINTRTQIHQGYKTPWESQYRPIDLLKLEEFCTMLYDHRGSGGV